MDWILDHLQVIIAIAAAIAYWIMQNKKGGEQAGLPPGDEEKTFADPELAERTRRIREEIQRRIDQRRGLPSPLAPAPELPPPLLHPKPSPYATTPPPVVRLPGPTTVRRPAAPKVVHASVMEARRDAEILEEQATLQAKLKEAEFMRAAALRRAQAEAQAGAVGAQPAGGETRSLAHAALLEELRDPNGFRRAFLLREVLGPPVGLRQE